MKNVRAASDDFVLLKTPLFLTNVWPGVLVSRRIVPFSTASSPRTTAATRICLLCGMCGMAWHETKPSRAVSNAAGSVKYS